MSGTEFDRNDNIETTENSQNSFFFLQSGSRHFKGSFTNLQVLDGLLAGEEIQPLSLSVINPICQLGMNRSIYLFRQDNPPVKVNFRR